MEGIQISVLVVDDDLTCLSVVAEYLQRMDHHVVAINNPIDALITLRMNRKGFDLVLTDVHMPQMSGLELLKHVGEEFEVPVVLMSVDCDEDIMLKGLEDGASFYLVKPITQESLAKLWQFALSGRGFSTIDKSSILTSNNRRESTMHGFGTLSTGIEYQKGDTLSSNRTILKRANIENTSGVKDKTNKKSKLMWTTSLHNLFLEAINKIGLENVVPKKILDYMNVPGLRRENVASHLQKYRIFLRRIAETSDCSEGGIPASWNERPPRSSFVINEITYLATNLEQQYKELLTQRGEGDIKRHEPVFKCSQKEVPTTGDRIEMSFRGALDNPTIENIQLTTTNYVGLRISSNGELVGTLNNSTTSRSFKGNNLIESVLSDGKSDTMVTPEVRDAFAYKSFSQSVTLPSFEMDDAIVGGLNETSSSTLREMDNLDLYLSDFEQQTLFTPPHQMVMNHDIDIHFDSQKEQTFGTDFGFGSFDMPDDGLRSFDELDKDDNVTKPN